MSDFPHTPPKMSWTFSNEVNAEIRRAAATGIYDIRGGGSKRRLPHFDDLLFLGASISRYPLEGYREKCATDVWLGTRFAKKPIHLDIPVTIAGMSFGALSGPAKEALGRGASAAGTSTTTGDGGMTEEERGHSRVLVYQYLPSRYGMNPDDLRRADAIEIVVGQGAGMRVDLGGLLQRLDDSRNRSAERCRVTQTQALGGIFRLSGSVQLPNRRGITSNLLEFMAQAERYNTPLSVALVQVADFKKSSDDLAPRGGEKLLQSMAEVFYDTLRMPDKAGRYDNEEFLVVLPHTKLKDANMIADRVRTAVDARELGQGDKKIKMNVAIGAIQFRKGEDLEQLLSRAEQAKKTKPVARRVVAKKPAK